jgi:integrase
VRDAEIGPAMAGADRQAWVRYLRWVNEQHEAAIDSFFDATWGEIQDDHRSFLEKFLGMLPPRGRVLDAPRGTGKFFGLVLHGGRFPLGVDHSGAHLTSAATKSDERMAPGGVGHVQTRSCARADDQAALRGLGPPRLQDHRSGPLVRPPSFPRRAGSRSTACRRLGPQTVSDVLRVLSQAPSRAEARGLVGRNPADPKLVHRPTGARASFTVIDPALAGAILQASTGQDPWDAAVHLALGLGLRREEVLGVRWEDVDDGVHVRQALTAASGELHFGPPKSKAGKRDLPMPSFVAAALQRHRLAQAERLLAIGLPRPELVVCNAIGQSFQPASFSAMWRVFATANGFAGITFHGLRHGAATLLLAAGVPDAVAAAIMGHADTKILRRYQDVVDDLKKDAASGMDALLDRSV